MKNVRRRKNRTQKQAIKFVCDGVFSFVACALNWLNWQEKVKKSAISPKQTIQKWHLAKFLLAGAAKNEGYKSSIFSARSTLRIYRFASSSVYRFCNQRIILCIGSRIRGYDSCE